MAEIHDQFDTVLILDFGSQVSDLFTSKNLQDEGFVNSTAI